MSKTRIQLQYPYSQKWKLGYLNTNREKRKVVYLYNSDNERSSTQYARYLMAVKLGRFLLKDEHADHIDGDKTNDNMNNLRVIPSVDNMSIGNKLPDVIMICPQCGDSFSRTRRQLGGKLERAYANEICCSRSCGGKYSHRKL